MPEHNGHLRWSYDEINTVAKGAVYFLQKGSGHTRESAVLASQERWLTPDRRKTNFGDNIKKKLDAKINQFGSMPFDQLNLKEPVAPEARRELQRQQEDEHKEEVSDEVKALLSPILPELTLAAAMAVLLRELAKPVSDLVSVKIEQEVDRAIQRHFSLLVPHIKAGTHPGGNGESADTRAPVVAPAQEKGPKGNLPEKFYEPKVMLIGMVGSQHASVMRQFKHIDFRVFENGTSINKLVDMSGRSDYAYVMARNAPPKLKLKCGTSFVNGGVTNLCHLILERYGDCGEEAATKRAARQKH